MIIVLGDKSGNDLYQYEYKNSHNFYNNEYTINENVKFYL
jgi:hypothetical protein